MATVGVFVGWFNTAILRDGEYSCNILSGDLLPQLNMIQVLVNVTIGDL